MRTRNSRCFWSCARAAPAALGNEPRLSTLWSWYILACSGSHPPMRSAHDGTALRLSRPSPALPAVASAAQAYLEALGRLLYHAVVARLLFPANTPTAWLQDATARAACGFNMHFVTAWLVRQNNPHQVNGEQC